MGLNLGGKADDFLFTIFTSEGRNHQSLLYVYGKLRAHGGILALVGAAGIEPATTGLEIRCSIRLSYAPISKIYHKLWVEYHAVSH